jgi:hypothetical protein
MERTHAATSRSRAGPINRVHHASNAALASIHARQGPCQGSAHLELRLDESENLPLVKSTFFIQVSSNFSHVCNASALVR